MLSHNPDQFFIQFLCLVEVERLVKVKHDNTLLSLKESYAHKLHSKYIQYGWEVCHCCFHQGHFIWTVKLLYHVNTQILLFNVDTQAQLIVNKCVPLVLSTGNSFNCCSHSHDRLLLLSCVWFTFKMSSHTSPQSQQYLCSKLNTMVLSKNLMM